MILALLRYIGRKLGILKDDKDAPDKKAEMIARNRKIAVIMNHFRDHQVKRDQATGRSANPIAAPIMGAQRAAAPAGTGQNFIIPPDGGAVGKNHAAAVQYTTGSHTVSKRTRRRRERGRTRWR